MSGESKTPNKLEDYRNICQGKLAFQTPENKRKKSCDHPRWGVSERLSLRKAGTLNSYTPILRTQGHFTDLNVGLKQRKNSPFRISNHRLTSMRFYSLNSYHYILQKNFKFKFKVLLGFALSPKEMKQKQIQQPRLPSIHTKIVPRNMSSEVIFKRSIHKQKTMREPAEK